jgi:hypothetical protein
LLWSLWFYAKVKISGFLLDLDQALIEKQSNMDLQGLLFMRTEQ